MGLFVNTLNNTERFYYIADIKQIKEQITMEHWFTSKEIIKEFCEKEMSTHTDWTGTRVETKHNFESVEAFVDKLMEWIEDNHYRC